MGCCCKGESSEENLKQSQLVPSDDFGVERLKVKGLEVKNCSPQDVDVQAYVQVVNTYGNNPSMKLESNQEIRSLVREEDGKLELGKVYKIIQNQKIIFLLVLPIFRNTSREHNLMKQVIKELSKEVINNNISSICIDEIGVRYFGFPRQIIIENLVETFQMFMDPSSCLHQIFYVSKEMTTVNMFEVNLKKFNPEFQNNNQSESQGNNKNNIKSDLEQPLLG